ncbi:hypothetical protein [Clostridium sp.]|uniref:hypothetical protein n=1 Tax=Clostridium sp. TaxID=1506 RepID=UPI001D47D053|nr:hypothetical protein [Clostridium sp.]MBS5987229.1 hypothetical protein [Clostridium sp.]
MDKAKKVCKYQIETFIKPTIIYYLIFIAVIVVLSMLAGSSEGNFRSSGLELSTWIFIFVTALNSFKGPFYFSQANNVSRKSFYLGTLFYSVIVSLIIPVIDIIINRIYNLFVGCPMNYDMIYGKVRDIAFFEGVLFKVDNSITSLLGNYLFLVGVLLVIFSIGLLITTVLFRLNKIGKYIAGGIIATLVMTSSFISESFWINIGGLLSKIFGYESRNVYVGVTTLIVISSICFVINYILQRKAEATK